MNSRSLRDSSEGKLTEREGRLFIPIDILSLFLPFIFRLPPCTVCARGVRARGSDTSAVHVLRMHDVSTGPSSQHWTLQSALDPPVSTSRARCTCTSGGHGDKGAVHVNPAMRAMSSGNGGRVPSVHGGREGPPDIWTWECTHGAYITGGLGRALEESNITLPPPDHPLAHKFDGGPSGFRRVFLHPPIPMYYPVFAGPHQRRLIFSSSLTAPPPGAMSPLPPGCESHTLTRWALAAPARAPPLRRLLRGRRAATGGNG